MSRTIRRPMALPTGSYFRLRIDRRLLDEWVSAGYHNQPFATREEAESAARQLEWKVANATPGQTTRVMVVAITSH